MASAGIQCLGVLKETVSSIRLEFEEINHFVLAIDIFEENVVGENGVRLDKNFLFAIFLVVFTFFKIFFVRFVKCAFVYFQYFLYIFPFKNKVVLAILKSEIFWAFLKKTGQNWTGSVLKLDNHDKT
jgi:hypothetical protein